MSISAVGVMMLVAFAICAWSGRTLAHHYQDILEIIATLAVAVCVFGSLVLTGGTRDAGSDWPETALGFAMTAGLFAGYMRAGPRH